jgi:hypothetical protein
MMARGLGNVYLRDMRRENAEDFGHGGNLEGCADTDEEVAGLDVGRGEGGVGWTERTEEGVVEFFGEWFAEEGYVRLIESVRSSARKWKSEMRYEGLGGRDIKYEGTTDLHYSLNNILILILILIILLIPPSLPLPRLPLQPSFLLQSLLLTCSTLRNLPPQQLLPNLLPLHPDTTSHTTSRGKTPMTLHQFFLRHTR